MKARARKNLNRSSVDDTILNILFWMTRTLLALLATCGIAAADGKNSEPNIDMHASFRMVLSPCSMPVA